MQGNSTESGRADQWTINPGTRLWETTEPSLYTYSGRSPRRPLSSDTKYRYQKADHRGRECCHAPTVHGIPLSVLRKRPLCIRVRIYARQPIVDWHQED